MSVSLSVLRTKFGTKFRMKFESKFGTKFVMRFRTYFNTNFITKFRTKPAELPKSGNL